MAGEYSSLVSDLRNIQSWLETINQNVNTANDHSQSRLDSLSEKLSTLTRNFNDFAEDQELSNRTQIAETRLVKIRQELDSRFGHYSEVRRTMVGILQADDLGIIRANTITGTVEELMLGAPDYWLAPCLVSLSAWINDKPELSSKALKEALRRDDEKTSLLFTLICNRSGRRKACVKWLERYLDNQDEENMDSKCIVVLDAFAGGLLETDSENIVLNQVDDWLTLLNCHSNFESEQRQQWADAIYAKRNNSLDYDYPYLKKYSPTWGNLRQIMVGADLHSPSLDYFSSIFNQETTQMSVKKQIDELLFTLVEDFDDDETPLRKSERLEQLVIDFAGNESNASGYMDSVEEIAFEKRKNFMQIMTDAVLNSHIIHSSPSVRQFAAAISIDWIIAAYNDVTAANRMQIPDEIRISIAGFNDTTSNGSNEQKLIANLNAHIDEEKKNALLTRLLPLKEKIFLTVGGIMGVAGLFAYSSGEKLLGVPLMAAGAYLAYKRCIMIYHLRKARKLIDTQHEKMREAHTQILLATLAEVVDFRAEFREKDSKGAAVVNYLQSITPSQYIKRRQGSTRKIRVAAQ